MKIVLIFVFFMVTMFTFSEDDLFDVDNLFMEEEMTIESVEESGERVDKVLNEESVSISGEVSTKSIYGMKRDFIINGDSMNDNEMSNTISGNIYLDVRLKKGIKSFMSVGVDYYNGGEVEYLKTNRYVIDELLGEETTEDEIDGKMREEIKIPYEVKSKTNIDEFFVDFNLENRAYFRLGKQNLKWGRGYFWNPTDLVNIEKKTLDNMESSREGVFGGKVHIPFGVSKNIYFFLAPKEEESGDSMALSGKYEFLIKNTEMSFSFFKQQDLKALLGYDISTRVKGIDLRGELSMSSGDNGYKLKDDFSGVYQIEDEIVSKISVGFTKSFDIGEEKDRVSFTGEYYYNGAGYDGDMLDNIFEYMANNLSDERALFDVNSYGKYYMGYFITVDKFPMVDSVLSINSLSNMSDNSHIVSSSVVYDLLDNFQIKLDVTTNLGRSGKEYTHEILTGGRAASVELSTILKF